MKYSSIEQINASTIQSEQVELNARLVIKLPDESGIFTEEEYSAELELYKLDLIQELADFKISLKSRMESLSDFRMASDNAGLYQPNLAALALDISEACDEAKVIALEEADALIVAERAAVAYKKLRQDAYELAGLTFEKFIELQTEDDVQGIADYRAAKIAIQLQYPKPE